MTIGILSWGSHKTLEQSLQSYTKFGLDKLDDDRIIFFQEISDEDFRLAEKYGWIPFGSPTNVGIAEGYSALVSAAEGNLFLFLENDWKLLQDPRQQIREAGEMLLLNIIDVARFRHRINHGYPLWSKAFEGNELSHPSHLLDSIHWTKPDRFDPIWRLDSWYLTTAPYANWTNNPTMFRTDWLKENILPRIKGDIERNIQDWWQTQRFIVAQGEGLFQHNRID